MNVELLKQSNYIIFESIVGSVAYGTNTPNSDVDIRGIFRLPKESYMSLVAPIQEVSNNTQDIKYYELRKFLDLAKDCNPNIIELLYLPEECVKIKTPIMQKLIDNRSMFITKKAYHTFSGYAFAQIGKAKGQNKMVNHPEMAVKPKKGDFCWFIPKETVDPDHFGEYDWMVNPPCRPIPFNFFKYEDLSKYHASALEHTSNVYRLYFYGDKSKGVFRGDDALVCESIPFEDEFTCFEGLLIYNQHEFEKAMAEHRKYNDWIANRNDARWVDQEKGKLNYDQKNMMHCARLMMAGKNILTKGEPIVRFEGEQLQYLRDIRAGKFEYEDIMARVEADMKELEDLYNKSTLPWGADIKQVDALYKQLLDM
jgi:predicted nucleotidyltransferase